MSHQLIHYVIYYIGIT